LKEGYINEKCFKVEAPADFWHKEWEDSEKQVNVI
jgi:hypothetical protein